MNCLSNILPKDVIEYIMKPYYCKYINIREYEDELINKFDTIISYGEKTIILRKEIEYYIYHINETWPIPLKFYLQYRNCIGVAHCYGEFLLLKYNKQTSDDPYLILTKYDKLLKDYNNVKIYFHLNDTESYYVTHGCDDKYVYITKINDIEIYKLNGQFYKTIKLDRFGCLKYSDTILQSFNSKYLYIFQLINNKNENTLVCDVYSKETFLKTNIWMLKKSCLPRKYVLDDDLLYTVEVHSKIIKVYNAITSEFLYNIKTNQEIIKLFAYNGELCYMNTNMMYSYTIRK